VFGRWNLRQSGHSQGAVVHVHYALPHDGPVDDLQRVAGGKELSEELKVETEADESRFIPSGDQESRNQN